MPLSMVSTGNGSVGAPAGVPAVLLLARPSLGMNRQSWQLLLPIMRMQLLHVHHLLRPQSTAQSLKHGRISSPHSHLPAGQGLGRQGLQALQGQRAGRPHQQPGRQAQPQPGQPLRQQHPRQPGPRSLPGAPQPGPTHRLGPAAPPQRQSRARGGRRQPAQLQAPRQAPRPAPGQAQGARAGV